METQILILCYHRIPKTDLYNAQLINWQDRLVLSEVTALPLIESLKSLHQGLQKYSDHLAGFKKNRADEPLGTELKSAYVCSEEETGIYRRSLAELLRLFEPVELLTPIEITVSQEGK